MKKLKRKDLLLEHYRLAVREMVTDRVTGEKILVNVWKPRQMGRLPAYRLLRMMKDVAGVLYQYRDPSGIVGPKDDGAVWVTGNPDFGAWDMQTAKRMDCGRGRVDIFVCALLVRPFSREAQRHYEERAGLGVWDRMTLMWDSRQFDEEYGFERTVGFDFRHPDGDRRYSSYDDLYRVVSQDGDIADGTV